MPVFDHPWLGSPWLQASWLQALLALAALALFAAAAGWIARVVGGAVARRAAAASRALQDLSIARVVRRLAGIVPALIVRLGVEFVPHLPPAGATLIRNVAGASLILWASLAVVAALGVLNEAYQRRAGAGTHPIKGYIQVAAIVVYVTAAILIVAALMDRSPMLLLSGLGAMAAVLMLVFRTTLLSLVASVQISSNDIVRVGDWIEMPQLSADGFVIDIALHTVKVRNWDNTVTTIPTHRLIEDTFKNWRAMFESGGRRIKRALMIDQNSVRFLAPAEIQGLKRFALLRDYLDAKERDIAAWNAARAEWTRDEVNARRITNLGTFRAYVLAYLKDRPDISDRLLLLVRQLAPSEVGLPLEIYCFTTTTAWVEYEPIQADIFDHLLAILPEFGLRLFQQPTGLDFGRVTAALPAGPPSPPPPPGAA